MAKLHSQPGTTVVRQVADHVKATIVRERLKPGAPLPSYRDLADELGVACLTVKRGMDELVAEGVISRQHGRGTFVARSLTAEPRELKHIGLIYPSSRAALLFRSSYLSEIMQGITQSSPSGGDMHIFSLRQEGLIGAAHLAEWALDGVLLIDVDNEDYLRAFASWGTPGVVVDSCPRNVALDFVACDNAGAARRAVEHLAALGHRRVACAFGHPSRSVADPRDLKSTLLVMDSPDTRERHAEGVRALQGRGMYAVEIPPADPRQVWREQTAKAVKQCMRRPDRPTALLTDSDFSAMELMAALSPHGLRVPQDISICAIAGSRAMAGSAPVRCSCCCFDFDGMGRTAVRQLTARCRRPQMDKPRAQRVEFDFVEGDTTRRVNP